MGEGTTEGAAASSSRRRGQSAEAPQARRHRKRRSRATVSGLRPLEEDHVVGQPVHTIFPEVPEGERRVEEPLLCFRAGLPGQLHITRNYLCWNGNIFGQQVVVHFVEILSVEKRSKFVDSIQIRVRLSCDDEPPSPCSQETLQDLGSGLLMKCSMCGTRLGAGTGCRLCNKKLCETCFEQHKQSGGKEDTFVFNGMRDTDRVYSLIHSLWRAHLRIPEEKRRGRPRNDTPPPVPVVADTLSDTGAVGVSPLEGSAEDEALGTLPYSEEVPLSNFSPPATVREKVTAGPVNAAPLDCIYSLLLSSGAFLKFFRETRGDTEYTDSAWKMTPEKWGGTRMVKYKTQTPLGIRQMYECQRFWYLTLPDGGARICLQTSSQAPDITYGTCFRVENLFDFTQRAGSGQVTVTTYAGVLFVKSTMMKSLIRRSALAPCEEASQVFVRLLAQRLARLPSASARESISPPLPEPLPPIQPLVSASAAAHHPAPWATLFHSLTWSGVAKGCLNLAAVSVFVLLSVMFLPLHADFIQGLPSLTFSDSRTAQDLIHVFQHKNLPLADLREVLDAMGIVQGAENTTCDAERYMVQVLYTALTTEVNRSIWMQHLTGAAFSLLALGLFSGMVAKIRGSTE